MKKQIKRVVIFMLAIAMVVPALVIPITADDSRTEITYDATIMSAKGGANAIATMTFDDGKKQTATKLNELCAQYGTKASLMLIPDLNFTSQSEIDFWDLTLSPGYLTAESHSSTHCYLTSDTTVTKPEDLNEEKYIYETEGARDEIRENFPEQDVLAMTIPYSNYIADARKHVISTYYAALAGECVLTTPGYEGRIMTLDPTFADPATGSTPAGSWHNVYYARLQPVYADSVYPQLTMENIIGYLTRCVEGGGWFITSCHGIYESENQDLTEEQLIMLLEAMSGYQKENKLWVATFSEATKYIRERQNSKATVTTYGDGTYYVDLTMADTTADGLSLTATVDMPDGTKRAIFDMPLTVKVELPSSWTNVTYSQPNGEESTVATFTELGKTYAYVDLVPNGGTATLTSSDGAVGDIVIPDLPAGSYTKPDGTYNPTNSAVTYAAWNSEADFLAGEAPKAEYTDTSLLNANIAGWGYIQLYADLPSSDKINPTTDIVINLAGYEITLPNGTQVGNTGDRIVSLTLKNGFVNNQGQLHLRAKSTFIIDNVDFYHTNKWIGYGVAGKLWEFKNSKLNIASQSAYFHLIATSSSEECELKFTNTDIVITGTLDSQKGLFSFTEQNYGTARWKVLIDSKSTLSGAVDCWASVVESDIIENGTTDVTQSISVTQKILIEEGFALTANCKPDFTYNQLWTEDYNTVTTVKRNEPANDEKVKISVAKKGTEYPLIGDVTYTEEGNYYVIGVENGKLDAPVGTYITPDGTWTPDSDDVTYAMWASESLYLAGAEPYKQYTETTLTMANFSSGGYFHFFKDVTGPVAGTNLDGKITPNASTTLVINLAGHTITGLNGTSVVNNHVNFTVKNGTIKNLGQQSYRGNNTVIAFENVHIYNINSTFGYGLAPYQLIYRDCIIELINNNQIFLGANPITSTKCEVSFENTDIIIPAADSTTGLFKIAAYDGGGYPFVIRFDADSSITGNVGHFFSFEETATRVFTTPNLVYFEEGFTMSSEYDFSFRQINRQTDNSLVTTEGVIGDNDQCKMIIVAKDSDTATEYDYAFVLTNGVYVLDIDEPSEEPEPEIWEPATNTVYAVWASKEDYEAGKAPVGEFSGNLTVANITLAGTTNYVRLFKATASVSEQLVIGTGVTVVIDLADNTLNNAVGIELWNGTSLTIENGVYNHTGGQVYFKPISYMTYRNLVLNVSYGHTINYGYGATELTYENCTVTLTQPNNYFLMSASEGARTCTINIIGTEFIINTDLSSHFFTINESGYSGYDARWTVNVDAESSITGSGSMPGLVKLTESFIASGSLYGKFDNTQTITFADGFTMSESLINSPSYYTFVEIDFDASVAAGAAVFKSAVSLLGNDARCVITINEDTLIAEDTAEPWAPADDTTYAVWASKESYLAGEAPMAEYTGDLLVANVSAEGVGYVRIYAETITTSDTLMILTGATIVIDLGGNTLNNTKGIEIYNGTSLTIENGTYNYISGQAYFKPVSYMTYRDLVINASSSQPLTYGYGFTEMLYERCTVYINNPNNYFRFGSNAVSRCSLRIVDTDFIVNTALSDHFFRINESPYGNENAGWDILIDKDSTITGTGSIPGLVKLVEAYVNGITANFVDVQNIAIEAGFAIAKNLITDFSVYTLEAVDSDASVAAGTAVYKDPVTKLANDEFCKIYLGETLANDGTQYANPNADSTAYSVSYAMDKVNVSFYRYDSTLGIWVGNRAVKNDAGVATFSNADFKKLSQGETIIFAQDIELADEIQSTSASLTDITFDLGGNKITIPSTLTDGFDLSLYAGGAYQRLALTWQNGTIDCFIRQPFYGYGGATSVFTFDNITLNYEDTGVILDCYFGTWIVKNSTVNAPNGIAVSFQKADGYQNIQIENSTINAKIPIRMYISGTTALSSDLFYIKDSTINATDYILWAVDGAGQTASSYYDLGISGCYIDASAVMNASSAIIGKVSVTLSDTYSVVKPVLKIDALTKENTDLYKVVAKTGEKIMGIEGVEGYTYYVGKVSVSSGDFQANLTLFQDFNLNFHANKDTIVAVYYNGEALGYVDFNGKAVYTVAGIKPDTAATDLEFVVWVKSGDVTYKVPLTYSALKYANSAVAATEGVTDLGKQLVTAAMDYVKAAYEYSNLEAPEFTGVSYTKLTAPETEAAVLPEALKSVQLELGTDFKLRFNITEGANASITVAGTNYNITDGKVGEATYIAVNMRAHELSEKGVVIIENGTAYTYTLAHYVNYAKTLNNTKLTGLVEALYNYAEYASDYKASVELD